MTGVASGSTKQDRHGPLIEALQGSLGADKVLWNEADIRYGAYDVFFSGTEPACIALPISTADVQVIVKHAESHGYVVVPRGGGMSYTRGYLSDDPKVILIDFAQFDRVRVIDSDNMFVTVDCGCTWKTLHEALAVKGLRVPVFGTMSGHNATVGGGLSQGSIFYGSSRYGTSADMVLGLEIVLADGSLLTTGQSATGGAKPFFRYYGPDISGIFLGDGGAYGIKTAVTLRLIRAPEYVGCLSFSFTDFESAWQTQTEIARAGLAAEVYCFDANLQHQLMERNSLIDDVAALRKVITSGKDLMKGMRQAIKVIGAGKSFMDDAAYSLHMVTEERFAGAQDNALSDIRKLAESFGGVEIPNSVPSIMRAKPFGSMDMTLGPSGERWVPVHGMVALSDGLKAMEKVQAYFGSQADVMVEHRILVGILAMVVAPSAFVIEALFYWPDRPSPLHEKVVSSNKFKAGQGYADNPAVREIVASLRLGMAEALAEFGAAHLGAARAIPYAKHRDPCAYEVLKTIKTGLDPDARLNPGVLGLGS